MMRMIILAAALAVDAVSSVAAEERSTTLPQITVNAERTSASSDRCVEVEIGSSRAFDCLNQKLRQQVDRINPVTSILLVDVRSQDIKLGIVNTSAVQQQYGKNFGVSVFPYRPAPPVFTSPLGPH